MGLSLEARVGSEPAGSSLSCNAPRPTGEDAGGGRLDAEEGPEANAGVSSLREYILQCAGQVEVAIKVANEVGERQPKSPQSRRKTSDQPAQRHNATAVGVGKSGGTPKRVRRSASDAIRGTRQTARVGEGPQDVQPGRRTRSGEDERHPQPRQVVSRRPRRGEGREQAGAPGRRPAREAPARRQRGVKDTRRQGGPPRPRDGGGNLIPHSAEGRVTEAGGISASEIEVTSTEVNGGGVARRRIDGGVRGDHSGGGGAAGQILCS